MGNIGIKRKFVLAAAVTSLAGMAIAAAAVGYHFYLDRQSLASAVQQQTRESLQAEAASRAQALARAAAGLLQSDLPTADPNRIARRLQPLLDDPAVSSLQVADAQSRTIYTYERPAADTAAAADAGRSEQLAASAQAPVRTMAESYPGTSTLRTLGEVRAGVTIALPVASGMVAEAHAKQEGQIALIIAMLGLATLVISVLAARWAGRSLSDPIGALVRSAERFSQGDYSRPVDAVREDELGNLQLALERMRQRLRQTTITKDYLNSVLGSMTDAVFVTSPDGVIKVANLAACRLLGLSDDQLIGKSILSILDESERGNFDLQHAANDTHETLARNRQGQTIPIALTGSNIANDDPQFQGIIFVARNITERKRAERRIRYLARYDALTKIPNRMQFQHLLQQAIARGRRTTPRSRCCTSTWTASRRSTTPSAMAPATARSRCSPSA